MPPSRPSKDRETKEARVLANRYEVVRKLGSGNFGTAFLCKDRKFNNENKVLKEISVGDLQPDETVDAMHEARLLSKLNHPCIVRFHDSFIDGEFFCIITEYCESGDLDNKISEYKKSGKSFDEKQILSWIIQLILAVQYMHSRRVLHRDLKTRNIFIQKNMMKIGDFGISRILMGTMDMASTFTGTPYYMSPEVLKHEGYNSKSDVWSVGCILYELCALEHAFMGQGLMAVMYKIVEKDPPDLPKKYSTQLDEVFKTMLTKEPDKRPSASEVLNLPYVSRHMAKMKDVMTDEFKAKNVINQDTADKEADEIAQLLREKSKMDDLRSTDDSLDGAYLPDSDDEKKPNMTAREKLRLKKIAAADKKAKDLMEATKQQLKENTERREKIKTSHEKQTLPAWKGGQGEGTVLKEALTVKDSRKSHKGYEDEARYYGYDDEDAAGTVRQPTVKSTKDQKVLSSSVKRNSSDKSQSSMTSRTLSAASSSSRTPNTLSMTMGAMPLDERPIAPMKDLMVYGRELSSLDFKDGIPEKADLAETFYSQFDSEFDEAGDAMLNDEDDDDNDVVYSDEDTIKYKDQEDFINVLEKALEPRPETELAETTTVNDDTILGAFGPYAREKKIQNMRQECIKMLGDEDFKKAYSYLRDARYSKRSKDLTEKQIMDGLAKYVKHPADCFIVDQLLFLEEQAKIHS